MNMTSLQSWRLVLGLTILFGCSLQESDATILGGAVTGGDVTASGGAFLELTPPLTNPLGAANSVGDDTFDLPNLYALNEVQNVVLATDLAVDIGASPIAAGTTVASHYVFFDPNLASTLEGTVDFDSEVAGIITSTNSLASSDFLANPGVNYLNPTLRGLEAGDIVTISGPNQISVALAASTPGDYIRVITLLSPAAVPEPSTLLLACFSTLAIAAHRRNRCVG